MKKRNLIYTGLLMLSLVTTPVYAQDKMSFMDFGAVKYVVRDGFAESFTRFDSDVCEQFLNVYELCVKKYYN